VEYYVKVRSNMLCNIVGSALFCEHSEWKNVNAMR